MEARSGSDAGTFPGVAAVHEAGHAVVAAYLRVPFFEAVIVKMPDGWRYSGWIQVGDLLEDLATWRIRNRAIMLLASRAAVEEFDRHPLIVAGQSYGYDIVGATSKDYRDDERDLNRLLKRLPDGRKNLLTCAREIVRIPYIHNTIFDVASALIQKHRLNPKQVREMLRRNKTNV